MDSLLKRAALAAKFQQIGVATTWQESTTGTYDPATGDGGKTSTPIPLYGIIEVYNAIEVDGDAIRADDLKIIIAGLDNPPMPPDSITIGAVSYQVVSQSPVMPLGIAIMHVLQLRR